MSFSLNHKRGFTLLEILVVISVIAVAMGTMILTLSPDDHRRDIRTEALTFQSLLKLLVDESIFKHKEIGLKIYEDRIAILVYNNDAKIWQLSSDQKTKKNAKDMQYQDYKIPAFIDLVLEMEDVELFLNPQQDEFERKLASIDPLSEFNEINLDDDKPDEIIEPDIFIFSSGEITAFDLEFHLTESETDYVYVISANDIGAVSCKAMHEEDEQC